MVGEEGCVSGSPEDERGDERVAQEALVDEEDDGDGQQGAGIEDGADPLAVGDGVVEDRRERYRR